MNILLLERGPLTHNRPQVNGTQTMILRMARQIKADGHTPYFVRFNEKSLGLLDAIDEVAVILPFRALQAQQKQANLPSIDVIHCFTADMLLLGFWLKNQFFQQAKIIAGFYHPRQYYVSVYGGKTWLEKLYGRIFSELPEQNMLFMDEPVRKSHAALFGRDLAQSILLPLPVELKPVSLPRERVEPNKIVSIGRLVSFKMYAANVIQTISELNREGHRFEYHVYGNGPLLPNLQQQIAALQAERYVTLHGEIPYDQLQKVVSDAGVFIGMGTSLIEAASFGVPSLVAIESVTRPVTYGLFHRTGNHEIGEQLPGQPEISLRDSLLELAQLGPVEYQKECELARAHTTYFSLTQVMQQYYHFVAAADSTYTYPIQKWMVLPWALAKTQERFLSKPETKHK